MGEGGPFLLVEGRSSAASTTGIPTILLKISQVFARRGRHRLGHRSLLRLALDVEDSGLVLSGIIFTCYIRQSRQVRFALHSV